MASVRNIAPITTPMYPTNGRIHIVVLMSRSCSKSKDHNFNRQTWNAASVTEREPTQGIPFLGEPLLFADVVTMGVVVEYANKKNNTFFLSIIDVYCRKH